MFFDGQAAGVPREVNLVGASLDASGRSVVCFDVPAQLAGEEYPRGRLARWNGAAFEAYALDGDWPDGTAQRGLSLPETTSVDPLDVVFFDGFESGDTTAW